MGLDKTIYVSGPIGNGGKCTKEEQLQHVHNGEDIYGKLIELGYAPYCPHMSYYPDKRWKEEGIRELDHDAWMLLDEMWVEKCEYFFYMTPEKYGPSKGAAMELKWAEMHGKVIYTDINEVPDATSI